MCLITLFGSFRFHRRKGPSQTSDEGEAFVEKENGKHMIYHYNKNVLYAFYWKNKSHF